jgi:hypothetical protein
MVNVETVEGVPVITPVPWTPVFVGVAPTELALTER